MWIRNPFADGLLTNRSLTAQVEDSLAELSTDRSLKVQFSQLQLADFWLYVMTDYPGLSRKALKCLTVFPTTYLCETALSHLTYLKSKLRNKLEVESVLILKLSDIEPNITEIINQKQLHCSH